MSAHVTVVTSDTGYLTKVVSLNAAGAIDKSALAFLTCGSFEVKTIETLDELDALLSGLTPSQSVTYGHPATNCGRIVADGLLTQVPGAISRTRKHFSYSENRGVLMFDYDPAKGHAVLSADEWHKALVHACPFLRTVASLWRASSSSGIDGKGVRGQRLYMMIDDATEIPRVGKLIFDRLWLAGHGFFAIGEAGQLLDRSLIDATVYKPEGLDFVAQPVMLDGIQKTNFPSQLRPGEVLCASDVVDLLPQEKENLIELKREARAKVMQESMSIKALYMAKKKPEIVRNLQARNLPLDEAVINSTLQLAVNDSILLGDWPLVTQEGEMLTVNDVLDNPEKWHGTRFADPLEPKVDPRVGWANLRNGRKPYLYSHLHGGQRYALERARALIFVEPGQLPRMVDALTETIKKSGELYTRAGGIVRIDGASRIVNMTLPWLVVYAERVCRFDRFDIRKNCNIETSCPDKVAAGVMAQAGTSTLAKLTAVRTAPTMASNGRLIMDEGYDGPSSLFLVNESQEPWPPIAPAPSSEDLRAALEALWTPFALFPFSDQMDAAVCLAAALTAAVRPCLTTAPGFGFSATAPGTGKTLLAQCIGTLYDGVETAAIAPIIQEEEWTKTLFSAALGGSGAILIDNAEHAIESASLCVATTSPALKSRILGESRAAEVEHRLLIMATGNGLRFVGDLNRRFFVCRLDAKMEAAEVSGRKFKLKPLEYCKANRVPMVAAALTLIRGYVEAGCPDVCDGLASLDDWNKLVRSTIVWLVQQGMAPGFVDPKLALGRDGKDDPDAAKLAGLMAGIKDNIGLDNKFTVADLVSGASTLFDDLALNKSDRVDLASILDEIAGERGKVNTRRLGRWVESRAGRIVDGLRLLRAGTSRSKVALWKLSNVVSNT